MPDRDPSSSHDVARLRADVARARTVEERYERWFKRLDEQVRVLDRERQKFAAMVSQTDSCVFVTDPAGTIHWANPVLAALPAPALPGDGSNPGWIGRSCRDVCGTWDGGCPSAVATRGSCAVARALERGETVHQELHSRSNHGTRTLYLTALPIRGPDGKPHEVMIMAQDLSDLAVLQRSETRYRRLFECNANALLMVDPASQRILLANAMAGRLLACDADALKGLRLADLHDADVWSRIEPRYAQVLLEERPAVFEIALRSRDGGERLAEVSATRLELEGQAVTVVELRDITESRRVEQALRQAEERLRQSQKMEAVGRLAGGVAHDFNNLLTAIQGSCELLLLRLDPQDPLRRYAEEIQKSGARGGLLTRQLLSFGRREVLAPRILDVRAVVSEMDYMLKRLVGEDVDYVTRFGPRAASVRADQGQIEQVLMNLVVNARDAMPEGGRLTVEVSNVELDAAWCRDFAGTEPGAYALLAVSDTGCGMTPDVQARLYEPFFTTKERGRGTGLGLSTVYAIVTQWGGHIGLYTEPGRGTSFKVYLPLAAEAGAGEAGIAPSLPSRAAHGWETILLVEDEETVRGIAREILELHGYAVIEARDGIEALDAAEAHRDPIHLVLTDVVMPRMSGGHLAERLLPRRPETRVLFMSGYPDDAVVRNGLLDASAHFVQKPFSLEGLVHRVREVLDGPPRSPLLVPKDAA